MPVFDRFDCRAIAMHPHSPSSTPASIAFVLAATLALFGSATSLCLAVTKQTENNLSSMLPQLIQNPNLTPSTQKYESENFAPNRPAMSAQPYLHSTSPETRQKTIGLNFLKYAFLDQDQNWRPSPT